MAGDEPSSESRSQVLVLQGGGVLRGEITHSGDRYVIRQPQGEINIAASKVVAIGESLEAAYEAQRQNAPGTVEARLALADWCLRYKLLPQAARELMDARGLDADHPRIALLERRLAAAARPAPAATPRNVPSSHADTNEGGQQPALTPALLPPNLPDGVVEHFTRRVQPILVNNCTLSGCHQPGGKQVFQLDRSLLHGLGNRRTTASNLAATLALVDREQPQLSPLLTIPREVHGEMDDPQFTPRQRAAFAHLVDWVKLVTQTQPAVASATTLDDSSSGSVMTAIAEEVTDESSQIEAASYEADTRFEDAKKPGSRRRVQFGAPLKGWRLKNEVDAEKFNGTARPEHLDEQPAQEQRPEANAD